MSGRSASKVFQPVKPALDVPALEREVADRWRREDTEARYLVRNAAAARRFLPRWADHGQQPDGRPPRLGPHVQGPVPALPPCSASGSATRTGSTAGGYGSRSRSSASWGSRTSATSRPTASTASSNSARPGSSASPTGSPSRAAGSATGWTGTTRTSPTPTRTTHDLALPPALPRSAGCCTAATTSCRGVLAVALACRTWRSRPRLPRAAPPVGHDPAAAHEPGPRTRVALVWTTTPWTLSSNVAAAVHPDLVCTSSWTAPMATDGGSAAARSIESLPAPLSSGGDLKGASCWGPHRGPFDELPVQAGVEHTVIAWDEVTDDEGRGSSTSRQGAARRTSPWRSATDLPSSIRSTVRRLP